MRIPTEILDEIVAHSREEVPNECCGMIGARDGVATSPARRASRISTLSAHTSQPSGSATSSHPRRAAIFANR